MGFGVRVRVRVRFRFRVRVTVRVRCVQHQLGGRALLGHDARGG